MLGEVRFKNKSGLLGWRILYYAFPCLPIIIAAIVGAEPLNAQFGPGASNGLIGTVLLLFVLVCSFACWRATLPVIANAWGLRIYTMLGRSYDISWEEMAEIELVKSYIFATSSNRPNLALCIPLFLSDQQGFYDYVRQHAPADNPLRLWIEEQPGAKAPIFE
ncbi:MAG: hypothetical protein K8R88_07725 [Armatimonadetes bacterium]|nr:hypothetical protein [Armatimonadota bacterium]